MNLCFDAKRVGDWVCQRGGGTWDNAVAIGLEKDGNLIAGVTYDNYNKANIQAHIAGEGNWANRQFLATIFDYPFNQLNVKRVTLSICTTKKKAIDLAMQMGFIIEAELSQATPDGNLLIFRMFKNECKYLGSKYATFIRHS